jgi:pimeloyl-ACP methyl ester carboxylesterase
MKTTKLCYALMLGLAVASGSMLSAQVQTIVPPVVPGAKPVTVEHIKIHGAALEGNLEGDAVDRDVIVFLPPSYEKEKNRRYPVVYALHGFFIGAEQWTHEIHVPQTIEGAFALGAKEMIVVLPDSKTIYNGSMYSSSVTTGDFENFISHDVVTYIDAHYRTIQDRKSRGLVGHSMGGYGASRIGMKHPDVFGALYIMSPCCLSPMTGGGPGPEDKRREMAIENEKKIAGLKSPPMPLPLCRASALPSLLLLPPGRPIRRIRRSISTCREGWRSPAGHSGKMGGERAARVRGSVHRESQAVSRHRHGRRRPGRLARRCRQTARRLRQVRNREQL